jgi:hypothetical protein
MITAPAQRAEGRDGARPRTLACTADGVWLWPATPVTERRGGMIVPRPTPDLYRLVASLHGPSVHIPVLERAIATTAKLLNAGQVAAADEVLARLELPPMVRASSEAPQGCAFGILRRASSSQPKKIHGARTSYQLPKVSRGVKSCGARWLSEDKMEALTD